MTWAESRYGQLADRYEYFSDAIFRRIFQAKRVRECAEILAAYAGKEIVLVGHSNGCDIICRLIESDPTLKASEVHLFSAATEADFEKNGLNNALLAGRVGQIFLYGSHNDTALEVAGWTDWLQPIGLGYGILGKTGAKNVDPKAADRVTQVWRDDFDHGSWFLPPNFPHTMEAIITANPKAIPPAPAPLPVPVRPVFLAALHSKR